MKTAMDIEQLVLEQCDELIILDDIISAKFEKSCARRRTNGTKLQYKFDQAMAK